MTKSYHVHGNSVQVEVWAENTSDGPLRWNLWSNTRVPEKWMVWTPVDEMDSVRLQFSGDQVLDWKHEHGFFRFVSDAIRPGGTSKAFISSSEPWIAAFAEDAVFVKTFEWVELESVPPNQARVEIYHQKEGEGRVGFSEMEAHGNYRAFLPGEQIGFSSRWLVFPLKHPLDSQAQIVWLKEHQSGFFE